jgi:hypothetical protein
MDGWGVSINYGAWVKPPRTPGGWAFESHGASETAARIEADAAMSRDDIGTVHLMGPSGEGKTWERTEAGAPWVVVLDRG